MKILKKLTFAFAVIFLMASCELTQSPVDFDKDPNPPTQNGQGDETSGNPMDDGPPD